MRNLIFLLPLMAILFAGCQKDEYNTAPEKPWLGEDPPSAVVELRHSVNGGTKSMELKNIIYSGQEIYGKKKYFFKFWLTAAGSEVLPEGVYEIKRNIDNQIIYGPSSPRNGIEHKFQEAGTYTLKVFGVFGGENFSFENIQIYVTEEGIVELETHPVRLYNFQVNGNNASVDVAISTEEYSNLGPVEWRHLKRVNNLNFVNNLPVNEGGDSVRFTLSFAANHNNYVEFNAHILDGPWLTPSDGNPPSVLYSGSMNSPYLGSGSYFGFRFHIVSGGAELRTYGGQLLLTTLGEVEEMFIPGENGDGEINNYQVRWTGYTRWFKTSASNPSFRWKIGTEGDWEHISPSAWEDNPDYRKIQLPAVSGELRFQFGTGTGSNFSPSSAEMQNSQYYEYGTGHLVVNI